MNGLQFRMTEFAKMGEINRGYKRVIFQPRDSDLSDFRRILVKVIEFTGSGIGKSHRGKFGSKGCGINPQQASHETNYASHPELLPVRQKDEKRDRFKLRVDLPLNSSGQNFDVSIFQNTR